MNLSFVLKFQHSKTNILTRQTQDNYNAEEVRVRIRGLEMSVFRKILRTYLIDDPEYATAWKENIT